MNNNKATEIFKDLRKTTLIEKNYKAFNVAIEALEKQMPMKPSKVNDEYGFFVCSNCGGCIGYTNDRGEHKYCLMCGQKLDWD